MDDQASGGGAQPRADRLDREFVGPTGTDPKRRPRGMCLLERGRMRGVRRKGGRISRPTSFVRPTVSRKSSRC
ncbi:hypothetical protein FKP32DRAFT_1594191 [Trametes sanguinea]|nr:hypothetical protein FKP32DRAFT_1594191 [Trametes sanguinea]